jgi:TRAP-type C4-dicarboxylate transport system permease small subunit
MRPNLRRFDEALSWLSSAVLFAMMLLTSVDVFMRYVVSRPVPGAFEVSELFMALLIFTALPLVSLRDEHITVEFAGKLIPARVLPYVDAVVHLCIAFLLAAAGWLVWLRALRMQQYGDATTILSIPVWPLVYGMAALLVVTGAVHVAKAVEALSKR